MSIRLRLLYHLIVFNSSMCITTSPTFILTSFFFFFFFSSRRRHTRCLSDWSSDVCSSDLDELGRDILSRILLGTRVSMRVGATVVLLSVLAGVLIGGFAGYIGGTLDTFVTVLVVNSLMAFPGRSEERRVGKGFISAWMTSR